METLYKFKSFADELALDNSRNYKIGVLEKYKDDEDIKYYLNFIFNPFITTGISDKKLSRSFEVDYTTYFSSIIEILEYAKTNNTGSDKNLSIIFTNRDTLFEDFDVDIFTGELDIEDFAIAETLSYELFNKILTKNIQIGIDVKTINKVINNLIPTFNVMLANKYSDNVERLEGKEFVVTSKIDGGRIVAIKKEGEVNFYTRSGQLYEGLVDLEREMEEFLPDNFVLDGEITLLSDYEILNDLITGEPCVGRKIPSKELYKETMKITRKDGEKHGVKMLVFDGMPIEDFEKQLNITPYVERRAFLEGFVEELANKGKFLEYFELLPVLYKGTDTNKITELLDYNISCGEEGIMINIADAPYEFKRSNNLLKVKKMQTIDLQVIDFEEGTNSNEGVLGALLVRYKEGNVVKVGSGYSKELRKEIWENRDSWLNSIIEVQYFEETENANGGKSLRFPVFKDRRLDKEAADY